jgi:hypothetical protein
VADAFLVVDRDDLEALHFSSSVGVVQGPYPGGPISKSGEYQGFAARFVGV